MWFGTAFSPSGGVVVDVDPEFANTEEWYQSIPEDIRPSRDQPFYHLLAENEDSYYGAYVSEGNLIPDARTARSATRRCRKPSKLRRRTLHPARRTGERALGCVNRVVIPAG